MIDTSTAAVTLVCNALKEYVCWHGPIHEEEQEDGSECPGDDTCECGHKWLNDGANGACRLLPALAEERDGLSELCHRAVEDRNALFQRVTELESANMRLRESWREDVAEARAERDAERQRADAAEAEAVTLRGANKRLMVVVQGLEAEVARLRAQGGVK